MLKLLIDLMLADAHALEKRLAKAGLHILTLSAKLSTVWRLPSLSVIVKMHLK